MEHETIAISALQSINNCRITHRPKSRRNQRLGLSPGKERRPVSFSKHAYLDINLTHRLGVTTINSRLTLNNCPSDGFLLESPENTFDFIRIGVFIRKGFNSSIPQFAQFTLARHLLSQAVSLSNLVSKLAAH